VGEIADPESQRGLIVRVAAADTTPPG